MFAKAVPNNEVNNELPESPGESKKPSESFPEPSPMRWMGYGTEFLGVLGIFTWAGYKLDQRCATFPWFMIGGLMVALTGMTYLLFKETRKISK